MQNEEAKATVESVPGTTGKAPAKPKGLLQGESGGMILLTGAILGCVLIAWGFQRNAKRKIAATETEYGEMLRPRAESGPLTSYLAKHPPRAQGTARGPVQAMEPPAPAAERAGVRNQAELAADVSEIATLRQDLREVGQKAVKELDERLGVLEAAILRAETLVQRLEAATRSAGVGGGATSASSMAFPSAPVFAPQSAPRTESYVEARPAVPVARGGRDDTRTIIELAEQGLSAREIAQQVGRPIGQVELIIALRGKGVAARS